MGNTVAELQEKVKFLQGGLVAIETKSGIESVFEQEKAQGRVEATSDLRSKLEALRDYYKQDGDEVMVFSGGVVRRLTAILDGKG